MPKDSEKPQGKENKKDKPKKKKLLLILLIVLVVLAGSAAGWYFFFKSPAGDSAVVKKASSVEEKKAPEKNPKAAETLNEKLDLGEVVVNLAGNGGGHYLRVKVVLEYPKDNKNLAKELKDKQHQVMDTLIATLRTKTLTDVTSASSVENLKKSLLTEINNILKTGDINGIFFTDFLVQ
ncbi:flagellar basal body-associated FliL family protein [Pelotomaculum sp. PtaB.Bin117]|uniref:flagellar basal body-associated FliL family protein n=1 Tax=Pelotomaculum sp. PtaB.Bin117 TaxID=1811694 RepID=UPI0009C7F31E|nr:flagellar basal body-associated FliL family protein [Pelotomaculum sp. PtaB.Bin117]OPX88936.1 MAG: flagellar basal body-associated protein FliL [Pelotomaculum sp. PtaB.Bin117]